MWAELYDDSPYHPFGVIQTFHVKASNDPTSPICHHIRHQCRKECNRRTDLGITVEEHRPLGLKLCEKFGLDTQNGGATLVSHARLEGEGCGLDASQNEAFLPRSDNPDDKLCCVHTPVTEGGETVNRFGWNPDCEYKDFIFL